MSDTIPVPKVKLSEALFALAELLFSLDDRFEADPLMIERFKDQFDSSFDELVPKNDAYQSIKLNVLIELLRHTADCFQKDFDSITKMIVDLTASVIFRDIQHGRNWDGESL